MELNVSVSGDCIKQTRLCNIMEGDLSKKSIHINESFVHAIYIGIVVNSYSDIVAYI